MSAGSWWAGELLASRNGAVLKLTYHHHVQQTHAVHIGDHEDDLEEAGEHTPNLNGRITLWTAATKPSLFGW